MIDYLKFIFYFSIVPVTPVCVFLIDCLRDLNEVYSISPYLYICVCVLIYVINCFFWGTCVYNYSKIEKIFKKILGLRK